MKAVYCQEFEDNKVEVIDTKLVKIGKDGNYYMRVETDKPAPAKLKKRRPANLPAFGSGQTATDPIVIVNLEEAPATTTTKQLPKRKAAAKPRQLSASTSTSSSDRSSSGSSRAMSSRSSSASYVSPPNAPSYQPPPVFSESPMDHSNSPISDSDLFELAAQLGLTQPQPDPIFPPGLGYQPDPTFSFLPTINPNDDLFSGQNFDVSTSGSLWINDLHGETFQNSMLPPSLPSGNPMSQDWFASMDSSLLPPPITSLNSSPPPAYSFYTDFADVSQFANLPKHQEQLNPYPPPNLDPTSLLQEIFSRPAEELAPVPDPSSAPILNIGSLALPPLPTSKVADLTKEKAVIAPAGSTFVVSLATDESFDPLFDEAPVSVDIVPTTEIDWTQFWTGALCA